MDFVRPYRRTGTLNDVERWKLARHPLDVADAVIERYSKLGPGAIAEVEGEPERLKWVGIYPQVQGGDAFMLRVKVPGGLLTARQAVTIGEVACELARGPEPHPLFGDAYCDITTRQDVQLHWVRIEDVPEIWRRLAEAGLTTVQACGDSARNVLCCPVSGVDAEEVIEAYPIAREVSDWFTGNREYANLPRKFKISITGCLDDCAQAEINDIGLWPARSAGGDLGFNVLAGGGLSDGPRMASDIDTFVRPDQVVEITRAIAQTWGELGNRENRGLSRMRYLVQELGAEGFRTEVAARAGFALEPAGEGLTRRYRGDHLGVHPQKQPGLHYVGCNVTVGRLTGSELAEAGRLASTYGDGTIRLATDQNLVLTGVAGEQLPGLLDEDLLRRRSPSPRPFERGAVACTGTEFCRFAIVETKERMVRIAQALDRRFGDRVAGGEAEVVRIHLSGCSASCAQPQIADIGLRGDTAHLGDSIVEALDVGVGGSLGTDAAFGDWIEGAMPADEVPDALAALVGAYLDGRRGNEPLHSWVRRSSPSEARVHLRPTAGASTSRNGNPS
ncbi:MAG: nitrite/sulfite reductase [Acidimicrobiales bacterium]